MTITLAAVYAPIGIQGGLTGALFREFAFTLAGAVIVSGVVALTLSPMMGSRLLRAGDAERGFAGWSTAASSRCARPYARLLARTARVPAGRLRRCGSIVVAPDRPFYMFSAKELAPTGGPGRRLRHRPGGAERDARPDQALRRARSTTSTRRSPRTQTSSRSPAHRRLRRHGHQAVERAQEEHVSSSRSRPSVGLSQIPGIRVISLVPPAAARRRQLPGRLRHRVDRRAAAARRVRQHSSSARRSRAALFMFADSDLKFDQPQAEVVFDRDKLRVAGRGPRRRPARTSRRCSAATTSTASASRAAATRSSRRSSAPSG